MADDKPKPIPALENIAREIGKQLHAELQWARSRPSRSLLELDAHYDALVERMATLAEVVAQVAAGNH